MALKTLGTDHMTAIEYLAMPKSERPSIDDIAKECGVSRSTVYEWKRDPLFEAELKHFIVRNNSDKLPELVAAIMDMAIQDSNAAMAKLALQMHGMLTDKVEVHAETTYVEQGAPDIESLKARILAYQQMEGGDKS